MADNYAKAAGDYMGINDPSVLGFNVTSDNVYCADYSLANENENLL